MPYEAHTITPVARAKTLCDEYLAYSLHIVPNPPCEKERFRYPAAYACSHEAWKPNSQSALLNWKSAAFEAADFLRVLSLPDIMGQFPQVFMCGAHRESDFILMLFEPLPVKRRVFAGVFYSIVYALFNKRIKLPPAHVSYSFVEIHMKRLYLLDIVFLVLKMEFTSIELKIIDVDIILHVFFFPILQSHRLSLQTVDGIRFLLKIAVPGIFDGTTFQFKA